MNAEQIEAAMKLADEYDADCLEARLPAPNELSCTIRSLATALKQAQAERKREEAEWVRHSELQQVMIADYDIRRRLAEAERDRYRDVINNALSSVIEHSWQGDPQWFKALAYALTLDGDSNRSLNQ